MPENDLLDSSSIADIDAKDLQETIELIQRCHRNVIDFYLQTQQGIRMDQSSIVKNRSFLIANYNICQEHFGFRIHHYSNESRHYRIEDFDFLVIESEYITILIIYL